MQSTLTFPSFGPSDLEVNPTFNVVVAYEDFETGKRAKKTYDYLAEHLGHECPFTNQMWKFDVLAVPKLRAMAAKDAAAADIIIIASHGTNPLPAEVRLWIELWLGETGRAIALVALFDSLDSCEADLVRAYLASVAGRGKMEFFSQPGLWPGRKEEAHSNDDAWEKHEKAFSVLAGVVEENWAMPRWGINE